MSKLPALLKPIAIGLIISTQLKCHQFKLVQVISAHASVRPTIRIKVGKFRLHQVLHDSAYHRQCQFLSGNALELQRKHNPRVTLGFLLWGVGRHGHFNACDGRCRSLGNAGASKRSLRKQSNLNSLRGHPARRLQWVQRAEGCRAQILRKTLHMLRETHCLPCVSRHVDLHRHRPGPLANQTPALGGQIRERPALQEVLVQAAGALAALTKSQTWSTNMEQNALRAR